MKDKILGYLQAGLCVGFAMLLLVILFGFLAIFACLIGLNGAASVIVVFMKGLSVMLVLDAFYITFNMVRFVLRYGSHDE